MHVATTTRRFVPLTCGAFDLFHLRQGIVTVALVLALVTTMFGGGLAQEATPSPVAAASPAVLQPGQLTAERPYLVPAEGASVGDQAEPDAARCATG